MPTVSESTRPRQQRTPAGWAQDVAHQLGVRPATVESWIHAEAPVHECLALIIRALVAREEVELLAKVDACLDAARATLPIPDLDDELIAKAVEADELEAIARDRYLLHRSRAALRQWRISLEAQRGMGFLLLLAVQRDEAMNP